MAARRLWMGSCVIAILLTVTCFVVAIADLAPQDKEDYTHYVEPIITVHVVDDLTAICGKLANGCAQGNAETCDIYIGERASPGTLEHEKRHCYGWTHATSGEHRPWYPINQLAQQE